MKQQFLCACLLFFICGASTGVFECSTNEECKSEGTCYQSRCMCPGSKIYSSDGTKCIELSKGYADTCEDDAQCSILGSYYKCLDDQCTCNEESVYLKGVCKKLLKLQDACSDNEDCFDGIDYFSRVCRDSKCECNEEYYERGGVSCRKISKIGEKCSIDQDCQFENSSCNNGVCVELEGTTRLLNVFKENVLLNSRNNITKSNQNRATCSNDRDCSKNMYCSKLFGECRCKLGYFYKSNQCVMELGMPCDDNTPCEGFSAECINSICSCSGNYIHKPGNQKCTLGAFAPFYDCIADYSCAIFGSNYECKESGFNTICTCKKGYELDENVLCQKVSGGAKLCKNTDDCQVSLRNSMCSSNGACICEENATYDPSNSVCLASIGGTCLTNDDCEISNTVCNGKKVCECSKGYAADGISKCIKLVDAIGDECTTDLECSGRFTNSVCDNGHCGCATGYAAINGACLRKATRIGDYCSHGKICSELGENVMCRKSSCQCNDVSEANEKRSGCKRSSASANVMDRIIFAIAFLTALMYRLL